MLSEAKRLLRAYGIRPKRGLGQSLCIDPDLIIRMVSYAEVGKSDVVLEVGAGLGFLTQAVLELAGRVITIELDARMAKVLNSRLGGRENVSIIQGDVLKIRLPKFNKVVSNPPYTISSPLLFKLLKEPFEVAVLTLQKEFAERLVASSGTKDYGRLSVMAYYRSKVELLERVPESSFYPPPRVESAVVKIVPRKPPFQVTNEELFYDLVKWAFTQRRKRLRNALQQFLERRFNLDRDEARAIITDLPYTEKRVYELEPEGFGDLSNEIHRRLLGGKRLNLEKGNLYVFPEVYEPSDDTYLLADHLTLKDGASVLDMGTGCGILAIRAAEKAKMVVAVDVNPHAIECAGLNARLNRVDGKVELRLGDLFQPFKPSERFDLIIFNPPYLPTEDGEGWLEKAWSGGKTGRTVIDRFLAEAPKYLGEHGRILLVQSTLSDPEETFDRMRRIGFHVEVLAERNLEFESLLLIQAHSEGMATEH